MKSFLSNIKKKNIGWWSSVATVLALIVALVAWLLPNPFSGSNVPNLPPTENIETRELDILPRAEGKTRIILMRLDEQSLIQYRVTDQIAVNLREALASYPDIELLLVDQTISESQGSVEAQKLGDKYDADVVIWGWYGVTNQSAPLGIHFEVIQTGQDSKTLSSYCVKSEGQVRKLAISQLHDLTLQSNLSKEFSYLAIFSLGVTHYSAGNWDNAVSYFSDALNQLTPDVVLSAKTYGEGLLIDQSLVYFLRGNAYFESHKYELAINDLEKVKDVYPNDGVTIFNLAKAYSGIGNSQKAIEYFDQVIKIGDLNLDAVAYYELGTVYEDAGDYSLANANYNKALMINSKAVSDYFFLSKASEQEIVSYFSESLNKNKDNSLAFYIRGGAYDSLDKKEDALADYTSAINLNPELLAAYEYRAYILIDEKIDYGEAIQDLDKIVGNPTWEKQYSLDNPCVYMDHIWQYVMRGDALVKIGEKDKAYVDYQQAENMTEDVIGKYPYFGRAYYTRGYINLARGNRIKAIGDFNLATKYDPAGAQEHGAQDIINSTIVFIFTIIIVGVMAFLLLRDVRNFGKKPKKRIRRNAHRP